MLSPSGSGKIGSTMVNIVLTVVYTIVGAVLAIFAVSFLVRTYELTVLG